MSDYADILRILNAHAVPYLVIGAHALAFHGYERPTRDLDLFLDPERDPVPALREFGIDVNGFPLESIIRFGRAPNRIDLTNVIEHLAFADAWEHRIAGEFAGVPVHFPSLADLWWNKIHARRAKDHMDALRLMLPAVAP